MTDAPRLEHDVEYELVRLLRRARMRSLRLVAEIHPDLDYTSYLMLIAVAEATDGQGGGVRGGELADVLGVHKSTVSRGLAALDTLGLVERVPDPSDGRARLVALTGTAATRLSSARARRHAQIAEVLREWESEDLDVFARLLGRLNAAFES